MSREFDRKPGSIYRGVLFAAAAVLCFLTAGLLVQTLPGVREKLEREGTPDTRPAVTAQLPAAPTPEPQLQAQLQAEQQPRDEAQWYLYITGSVRKPGVYRLPPGSRLFHLVETAGGLNSFADAEAINMAATLEDEMHVHIPRKGERQEEENPVIYVRPTTVPGIAPRSAVNQTFGVTDRGVMDRVDINRATAEDLTRLKGIGPALAKNIVDFRSQNGRFRSAEDLLRVKGIGAKKLEGFRELVTVGP